MLHLIINWIFIDKNEISIGATDSERWQWDTEAGASGADARTCVWATLELDKKQRVISENVGLFCRPGDSVRELAISGIPALLKVLWQLQAESIDREAAYQKYFGMTLDTTL